MCHCPWGNWGPCTVHKLGNLVNYVKQNVLRWWNYQFLFYKYKYKLISNQNETTQKQTTKLLILPIQLSKLLAQISVDSNIRFPIANNPCTIPSLQESLLTETNPLCRNSRARSLKSRSRSARSAITRNRLLHGSPALDGFSRQHTVPTGQRRRGKTTRDRKRKRERGEAYNRRANRLRESREGHERLWGVLAVEARRPGLSSSALGVKGC